MKTIKLTSALLTLVASIFLSSYFAQHSSAAPLVDNRVNPHWKGASSLTPVNVAPRVAGGTGALAGATGNARFHFANNLTPCNGENAEAYVWFEGVVMLP